MSSIVNSHLVEDRYITYMAGLPQGQQPIGFMDKYHSYGAQKHPISNSIAANIIGTTKGIALTALGVLAYPFANETMKATFLGSNWNASYACANNVADAFNIYCTWGRIFDPRHATSYLSESVKESFIFYSTLAKCATDDRSLLLGRAANYGRAVLDTVAQNYPYIAAASVVLAALYTFDKNVSYVVQEKETEEQLIQTLKNRFGKIATRLTDLETNSEAQECAKRILQHRLQINTEIENLQLPSLNWKDIEEITQPVFDAALSIQP